MNPNAALIQTLICRRARWARSAGSGRHLFSCSLFQYSKYLASVSLLAWAMTLSIAAAKESKLMSAEDLVTRLRAGEDVIGEMLTVDADYMGNQTDPEGNIHALFVSRALNTTLLLLLSHTEDIEGLESLEGTILRVELQEQDLRDHRIYAIWIDPPML